MGRATGVLSSPKSARALSVAYTSRRSSGSPSLLVYGNLRPRVASARTIRPYRHFGQGNDGDPACLRFSNAWSIPIPTRRRQRRRAASSPFLWACSHGLRTYLLATVVLTGIIGAFEALLFSMLGSIVDWLGEGRAGAAVDAGAGAAAAAGRRARRQHAAGRAAVDDQAAGALRQFPDAAALELPPADARPEHGLLPGRVRRPHRDQGDADGAGRARHLAHRRASCSCSSSSTS